MMNFKLMRTALLLTLSSFCLVVNASVIRDITNIYGDRTNQLIGYGLVVGLDGTGDKSQVKLPPNRSKT